MVSSHLRLMAMWPEGSGRPERLAESHGHRAEDPGKPADHATRPSLDTKRAREACHPPATGGRVHDMRRGHFSPSPLGRGSG